MSENVMLSSDTLSFRQLGAARDLFDRFSVQSPGTLAPAELFRLMPLIGPFKSRELSDSLFNEFDTDNNGSLDFEEYLKLLNSYQQRTEAIKHSIEAAFAHLSLKFGAGLDREAFRMVMRGEKAAHGDEAQQLLDAGAAARRAATTHLAATASGQIDSQPSTLTTADVNKLLAIYMPGESTTLTPADFVTRLTEGAPPIFSQVPPVRQVREPTFTLNVTIHAVENLALFARPRLRGGVPAINPSIRIMCGNQTQSTPQLRVREMGEVLTSPLTLKVDWPIAEAGRLAAWVNSTFVHVQLWDVHDETDVGHAEMVAEARVPLAKVFAAGRAPFRTALPLKRTPYVHHLRMPSPVVTLDILRTDPSPFNPIDHRVLSDDIAFSSEHRHVLESTLNSAVIRAPSCAPAEDGAGVYLHYINEFMRENTGGSPRKPLRRDFDPAAPIIDDMDLDDLAADNTAACSIFDAVTFAVQHFYTSPEAAKRPHGVPTTVFTTSDTLGDEGVAEESSTGGAAQTTLALALARMSVPPELNLSEAFNARLDVTGRPPLLHEVLLDAADTAGLETPEITALRQCVTQATSSDVYALATTSLPPPGIDRALAWAADRARARVLALHAPAASEEFSLFTRHSDAVRDLKDRLTGRYRALRGRFRRRDFPILICDDDGRFLPATQFVQSLSVAASPTDCCRAVAALRTPEETWFAQDAAPRAILDPTPTDDTDTDNTTPYSRLLARDLYPAVSGPMPLSGRVVPTGLREVGAMDLALGRQVATPTQKAVLLASLLVGCGLDAYVAVGNDQEDLPVTWVTVYVAVDAPAKPPAPPAPSALPLPPALLRALAERAGNPDALPTSTSEALGLSSAPALAPTPAAALAADLAAFAREAPHTSEPTGHFAVLQDWGTLSPCDNAAGWEVATFRAGLDHDATSQTKTVRTSRMQNTPFFRIGTPTIDDILRRRAIILDTLGPCSALIAVHPSTQFDLVQQARCYDHPALYGQVATLCVSTLVAQGLATPYGGNDHPAPITVAAMRNDLVKAIVASDPLSVKYRILRQLLPKTRIATPEQVAAAAAQAQEAISAPASSVQNDAAAAAPEFLRVTQGEGEGEYSIDTLAHPGAGTGRRGLEAGERAGRVTAGDMSQLPTTQVDLPTPCNVGVLEVDLRTDLPRGSIAGRTREAPLGTSGMVPLDSGTYTGAISAYDLSLPINEAISLRYDVDLEPVDPKTQDAVAKLHGAFMMASGTPSRFPLDQLPPHLTVMSSHREQIVRGVLAPPVKEACRRANRAAAARAAAEEAENQTQAAESLAEEARKTVLETPRGTAEHEAAAAAAAAAAARAAAAATVAKTARATADDETLVAAVANAADVAAAASKKRYAVLHIDPLTGRTHLDPIGHNFPWKRIHALFNHAQIYCNVQADDVLLNLSMEIGDPTLWTPVLEPDLMRQWAPWQPAWSVSTARTSGFTPMEDELTSIRLSQEVQAAVVAYRAAVHAAPTTEFLPRLSAHLRGVPCAAVLSNAAAEGYSAYLYPYHPDLLAHVPSGTQWHGRPFLCRCPTAEEAVRQVASSGLLDCAVPGVQYAAAARAQQLALGVVQIAVWAGYCVPTM